MKFKEALELNDKNVKEGYLTEMSIQRLLYDEYKDYVDNDRIILSNDTKRKLEARIINLLLLTDEKTLTLEAALKYNLKISENAKKIYKEHKKEIDKIVSLISNQLDLNIKID
jgi:hypothetical protein